VAPASENPDDRSPYINRSLESDHVARATERLKAL
jgi:hypothetical protein